VNHYEMRAQGSHLTLSVNGVVVTSCRIAAAQGYIALEAEGTRSPSGT